MGYGVVRVWWLVNSLIVNMPLNFYEKDSNGEYQKTCSWHDAIFMECKDEIYQREIYFINMTDEEIKVYLREAK